MKKIFTGAVACLMLVFSGANEAMGAVVVPNDLVVLVPGPTPDSLPIEVQTKVTGHVLRLVPQGNFTMGSEDGDEDEKPVHGVTKSAYYLGKFPVSNTRYEVFAPGHVDKHGKYAKGDNHPVTNVDWNDAAAYIVWVGQQEGKAGLYAMPSEAAWEKASQGGLAAPRYPWGSTLSDSDKKFYSSGSAVPVDYGSQSGAGSPNGLGFYHMTGNVFCWCWDWYEKDYYGSSPSSDPYGPATGDLRSLRGGTWYVYDKSLRCADRWSSPPTTRSDYVGIRIGRLTTDF